MTATDEQITAMTKAFNNAGDRLPTLWREEGPPCACGCGGLTRLSREGVRRQFIWGHNARLQRKQEHVSYGQFHIRVRKARGTPKQCESCGTTDPAKRYEWANLTGNYGDPDDYKRLCKFCHVHMDGVPDKARQFNLGRTRVDMQGERHWQARLTETQVREIRRRAESESFEAIALDFGLSDVHVGRIAHRVSWKHLA